MTLAIHGGRPAKRNPDPPMFPGGNSIGAEEEQAVLDVLRRKRLFRYYGIQTGNVEPSKADELERMFAARTGATHAHAVTSGTAALVGALPAAGVGPGDEVIIPAYTWIATAAAVVMSGAIPIIAEVDESLTLDPLDVARKITPRTKAIIPVHMRGAPARLEQLCSLARERGLRVIEDVAQCNGGSYRGRQLGSIGDIGCFSFQFNKIVTCGEGGMVITSDPELYKRVLMFNDPIGAFRNGIPMDDWLPGLNHRMPEVSAAIAIVQIGRLDGLLTQIRRIKRMIKSGIEQSVAKCSGSFRQLTDPEGDTGIALVFFLPSVDLAKRAIEALRAENIGATPLMSDDDDHVYCNWTAIIEKRFWTAQGGPWRWGAPVEYKKDMCPRTLDLLSRAVHLNVNPLFTSEDIEGTVVGVDKVLTHLARV